MRKPDDKIPITLVYGLTCTRPEWQAVIVGPLEPRNALEAAWWLALDLWHEVVLPAFLFALSVTAFAWGFGLLG